MKRKDSSRARNQRRLVGYPLAIAVAAGLLYWGQTAGDDPALYSGYEGRVYELAGEGRFDEARALIVTLYDRFPEEVRVPLLDGWLEDGTGELDAAFAAYERARPLLLDDAAQHRSIETTLADIDRRRGRFEDAHARLDALEARHGLGERGGLARALVFESEKKLQDALSVLNDLADEHPESGAVRLLRSRLRQRMPAAAETSEGEVSRAPAPGALSADGASTLTTPK